MRDTIDMAREAGFETMLRKGKILGFDRDGDYTEELKAFEALVRADERKQAIAELAQQPASQEQQPARMDTKGGSDLYAQGWNDALSASQEQHNVKSSAGLIRPGKVDAWVANHYTSQPAPEQEPVAQAWDEGYRAGVDDERTSEANIGIAGFGAKVEPARNNPYRTTPPAQPAVPLTLKRVKEICAECGYDTANVRERADFINGIRQAEAAHGITRTITKEQA
jgi:hypothetical protein